MCDSVLHSVLYIVIKIPLFLTKVKNNTYSTNSKVYHKTYPVWIYITKRHHAIWLNVLLYPFNAKFKLYAKKKSFPISLYIDKRVT